MGKKNKGFKIQLPREQPRNRAAVGTQSRRVFDHVGEEKEGTKNTFYDDLQDYHEWLADLVSDFDTDDYDED